MKRAFLIFGFFLVISFSAPSYAIFDPYGPLIYGKQMEQLAQDAQEAEKRFGQLHAQFNKLSSIYQNAQDQLDQEKTIVQDNQGNYGWGNFANGQKELTGREWSPSNWNSALQSVSGGNNARYKELADEYKDNHVTLDESTYEKGASKANNKVYQQQINVNRAATVNASYAFNDIKQHLETLHSLSLKIEKTKNTKAALDLLARIVTEQSYISVQELKMQTLLNEQVASQQSSEIAAETASARFNTIPEKR